MRKIGCTLGMIVLTIGVTSCGLLGPQTTESNSDKKDSSGKFDPDSGSGVELDASSSEELKGSSVSIPAGALDVAVDINLEEGESLVSDPDLELLGGEGNEASEAGPALVIEASQDVDLNEPMQIAIPFSSTSLSLSERYLVVVFKVIRANEEGIAYSGVIPTDQLEMKNGKIHFETKNFGVFQAMYFTVEVKEKKEIVAAEPIRKKTSSSKLTGRWESECRADKDREDGGYSRESFIFGEEKLSVKLDIYTGENCKSGKMLTFYILGNYGLGKERSDIGEKVQNFDIDIKRVAVIPQSDQIAEELNHQKECERDDWETGKPVIVDGKKCNFGGSDDDRDDGEESNESNNADGTQPSTGAGEVDEEEASSSDQCGDDDGLPVAGETIYQILKIDGDKITLGEECGDIDARSDIGRPSSLEATNLTRKK